MALLDKDGLSYFWSKIKTKLNGKANVSHTHAIADVTNLQTSLDSKSNTGHTHDDRYYTESEINTKLNGKANSSHSHAISDITNLQNTLNGKANSSHSHSLLTEVKNVPFNASPANISKNWYMATFTLPTIDNIGKIVEYEVTSGNITNNQSFGCYYCIQISLPTSGSYVLLHKEGTITSSDGSHDTTIDLSKSWTGTQYDSQYSFPWVAKGGSKTVTASSVRIVLMRVA